MSDFYHAALQKLGIRQQAYKTTFAEGGIAHHVLVDLADYAHAFIADPEGLSNDQIREMYGRRQLFFRIFKHLKLSPAELEGVTRVALQHAAARLANRGTDNG